MKKALFVVAGVVLIIVLFSHDETETEGGITTNNYTYYCRLDLRLLNDEALDRDFPGGKADITIRIE
jgi:hypothetical protein